jgi:hypothetical protein
LVGSYGLTHPHVFAPSSPALRNEENLPIIHKTKHRPKRGRKRYKMKGPKSWQKHKTTNRDWPTTRGTWTNPVLKLLFFNGKEQYQIRREWRNTQHNTKPSKKSSPQKNSTLQNGDHLPSQQCYWQPLPIKTCFMDNLENKLPKGESYFPGWQRNFHHLEVTHHQAVIFEM